MQNQAKAEQTTSEDAITFLTNEHREVKAAFKAFKTLDERAYAAKKKLANQICSALQKHILIEEEIFYPAVKESANNGNKLINEAIIEHTSVKDLIVQIESMPVDDELFDATIKVLSEQVDHHVQEEEGEIFLQAKKTRLDLVDLGDQMAKRKEELIGVGL